MIQRLKQALFVGLTRCSVAVAATPSGDLWLTNDAQLPPKTTAQFIRSNAFEQLHAETVVGRLKVLWPFGLLSTNATVTLHTSADEPGHWPARDWRSRAMTFHQTAWEAAVPVEDINLPVVYFVSAADQAVTNLSPMRVCLPREAGLEAPTRIFWPFLEGFEEGTEGWRHLPIDSPSVPLKTNSTAKNGLASLVVSLPAAKRSVTVGTTRLRGATLHREAATGVRLWLRTREGTGQARFTLMASAHGTNQISSIHPRATPLDAHWQKVDLAFSLFASVPLRAVDFFTIEFSATGPRDFLVDEVQLLGPWKLDPE